MATAEQFVQTAYAQRGKQYLFNAQPSPSVSNPRAFDCSGLVHWAAGRVGVNFTSGSWLEARACRDHGTLLSIGAAMSTRGALLFQGPNNAYDGFGVNGHVAISLGNGMTIEARGKAYGVGSWSAAGRPWTNAGYIPGLAYGRSAPPLPPGVNWAAVAKYVRAVYSVKVRTGPTLQIGSRGSAVSDWQTALNLSANQHLVVDGSFGPGTWTATVNFQRFFKLHVDGIVGPQTRNLMAFVLGAMK